MLTGLCAQAVSSLDQESLDRFQGRLPDIVLYRHGPCPQYTPRVMHWTESKAEYRSKDADSTGKHLTMRRWESVSCLSPDSKLSAVSNGTTVNVHNNDSNTVLFSVEVGLNVTRLLFHGLKLLVVTTSDGISRSLDLDTKGWVLEVGVTSSLVAC